MAKKQPKYYRYESGKYVREKLASKGGCEGYRYVDVPGKPGRKLLICIKKKAGPRGGKTKTVALLRSLRTKKGQRLAKIAKKKRM
jgi:hypothetical protein